MRKSVKREYELDCSYDYSEAVGFRRATKFVKRSHRRYRQQIKQDLYNDKEKSLKPVSNSTVRYWSTSKNESSK